MPAQNPVDDAYVSAGVQVMRVQGGDSSEVAVLDAHVDDRQRVYVLVGKLEGKEHERYIEWLKKQVELLKKSR